MRKATLLLAAILLWPTAALAERPPELAALPEAGQKVGETSVRFLFWRIFDASLWSPSGDFAWTEPFALSLTYARDFTAESLEKKTVEEMARLNARKAGLEDFGRAFGQCIDDVAAGDRITAVSVDSDKAKLFQNGEMRCQLERPNLRREFFGIWLSPDSQFPEATARLIGGQR